MGARTATHEDAEVTAGTGTQSCSRNQLVVLVGLGMLFAWGWDAATADEPGKPPALKRSAPRFSATLGATDRGTPTAGFGLRF